MADPPEAAPPPAPGGEGAPRGLDRKVLLPAILVAAVIIVPVAIWAADSGGGDDELRVEQGVSTITGKPEIVVGIPRKYNNMAETHNKANVVLVCFDSGGKELFEANHDWPFIEEAGYDRPHVHQMVSESQLEALATCTVRGMKHQLTGTLRRS